MGQGRQTTTGDGGTELVAAPQRMAPPGDHANQPCGGESVVEGQTRPLDKQRWNAQLRRQHAPEWESIGVVPIDVDGSADGVGVWEHSRSKEGVQLYSYGSVRACCCCARLVNVASASPPDSA